MSVNLTENAIPAIIGGDVNAKPLVQVLDVALVSNINNSQQQRYKLLLSDAVLSKQALLATQLNDRVRTGRVQKGSVVQLLHYICTPIKNRKIIVILNMETIIPDCEIIGNPKPYMDSDLPSVGTKADNTVENLPRSNNNNNSAAQNASHNAQNFRPTIQPPYQPPPYKGRGAILKNEAPARIIPIAALNPYQGLGRSDKPDWITAIVIDGHLQNAELDEYIYHENLVHPALLIHNEPKTVFIMGGGGGSAVREVLKHKDIENVLVCDVDRIASGLIRGHFPANNDAINDDRVEVVYNYARKELEKSEEKFDVIIGDLPDPDESGPVHIYTKSFYENVAKPKLKDNGIFVTQAGPAGIFTHKAVFSTIYNTLKQAFTYVVAYTAMVPSYGDTYGWIMASDERMNLDAETLNNKIGERITGELRYLDGPVIVASTILNKTLRNSLMEETRILTDETMTVGYVRKPGVRRYDA